MVKTICVCCGTQKDPHDPTVMSVDQNGVDIFRKRVATDEYEQGDIVLTVGTGWTEFADEMGVDREPGVNFFESLERKLSRVGGDYYGCADRYVCPACGATIVWRA